MLGSNSFSARDWLDAPFWARLHPRSPGAHHASSQSPQSGHVSLIVARLIDRRFEDERALRQQRMIQNPAERRKPDLALSDVLVPVHARAHRHLRVVYVHHENAIEPYNAIHIAQRGEQTLLGMNAPAGGKNMCRVNA